MKLPPYVVFNNKTLAQEGGGGGGGCRKPGIHG